MAREFGRTERVADYLRQELARLLQMEVRDPRIGMVSVIGAAATLIYLKFKKVLPKSKWGGRLAIALIFTPFLGNAFGWLFTELGRQPWAVFGLMTTFWLPISHGMTMLTYANPLDFKKVCTIVRDEKATFIVGTPAFFWGYLRKSEEGDFASLRIAMTGADKCPDALREGFKTKHNITLYEGYGATECSPVISVNTPEFNRPGSVGKPIPGLQVRIENYATGEECGQGEDGRILVKGDSVMKGYFNDFEQTSLHIRHGWYDTGDMGNLDRDGYLWHVGRLKRFVKIGGEMVSLVKIEDILEKFLPEDSHCCVVEIPDAIKGAKIVAVVTTPLDEKTVLKQMAQHLPPISLPKIFLVWENLPKMGSGKIDFRTISEMAREQLSRKSIS